MGADPPIQHHAVRGVLRTRLRRDVEEITPQIFNTPPYAHTPIDTYGVVLNFVGRLRPRRVSIAHSPAQKSTARCW